MMNKMIVANLVHRPIRSLISIVAIALEVTLILLIVGLSVGMLNDARQRQAGISRTASRHACPRCRRARESVSSRRTGCLWCEQSPGLAVHRRRHVDG